MLLLRLLALFTIVNTVTLQDSETMKYRNARCHTTADRVIHAALIDRFFICVLLWIVHCVNMTPTYITSKLSADHWSAGSSTDCPSAQHQTDKRHAACIGRLFDWCWRSSTDPIRRGICASRCIGVLPIVEIRIVSSDIVVVRAKPRMWPNLQKSLFSRNR